MASGNGDVAATFSAHEERGGASTTDRFVVRKTILHWDVAKHRRLYPDTLDASGFGAMFSDGRHFTMLDHMRVRRETDTGT